ncbi:MAG TPA: hypothetical protein PKD64_13240 [Pirellulaceae bacterium]|nr:hypothetical protein [Pirellulaceae bacterium]HMO93151.1 hypothetical protein [Pirellulaceae bacterium]HMP70019.1 hypothetical protein [Pirellulaceae bacterium]
MSVFQKYLRLVGPLIMAIAVIVSMYSMTATVVHADDTIARMQQTIDAAEARIREIVRQLSTPGLSTEAVARLNREMKDQEWVKSQAELAIVKERDRQQKERAHEERIKREVDNYVKSVASFTAQGKTLNTDIANFNSEVRQYEIEVKRFNSGEWNQAEYNRLIRWDADLGDRERRLDVRILKHEEWRTRLLDWQLKIDALFNQK